MPPIDWSTLVNWMVSGLAGLFFGVIGAWTAHRLERRRDDLAWQREQEKMRAEWTKEVELLKLQFEQRLKELDLQSQREESKRLRDELLSGVDDAARAIQALEVTKLLVARAFVAAPATPKGLQWMAEQQATYEKVQEMLQTAVAELRQGNQVRSSLLRELVEKEDDQTAQILHMLQVTVGELQQGTRSWSSLLAQLKEIEKERLEVMKSLTTGV